MKSEIAQYNISCYFNTVRKIIDEFLISPDDISQNNCMNNLSAQLKFIDDNIATSTKHYVNNNNATELDTETHTEEILYYVKLYSLIIYIRTIVQSFDFAIMSAYKKNEMNEQLKMLSITIRLSTFTL